MLHKNKKKSYQRCKKKKKMKELKIFNQIDQL